MIKIENRKIYTGDGFYIGRPSPLGNPFEITLKRSRTEVISMYREWLLTKLETTNPTQKAFMILVENYMRTGELTLICWCSPLECHGEVIREFILEVTLKKKGPNNEQSVTSD